jgi:hypothetical protein
MKTGEDILLKEQMVEFDNRQKELQEIAIKQQLII